MLRVEGLGDSGSEPTHWQGRVDMRACGWVGIYVCMYVHICIYVCMYIYVCIYVCMYIYVYMYVCMYVYMYVWVDMRACGWVGEKADTDTDSNTDTLGFRV